MEIYINNKNNVNDITYMSELIPSRHQILVGDEGYPPRLTV